MTALTSAGPMSVFPIKIVFLNENPSHCLGSPSKIPVVGYSWAPKAYSTPWTAISIQPQSLSSLIELPTSFKTPFRLNKNPRNITQGSSQDLRWSPGIKESYLLCYFVLGSRYRSSRTQYSKHSFPFVLDILNNRTTRIIRKGVSMFFKLEFIPLQLTKLT